jgi:uncharacterized protein (DUF952 family)
LNLYHITTRAAWIAATRQGSYAAESLGADGFIHCSTSSQVLAVARQFYAGQNGLVLLAIDPNRLSSAIKWEPAAGGTPPGVSGHRLFPHVYGRINLEAVVQIWDFDPDRSGQFPTPFLKTSEDGGLPA